MTLVDDRESQNCELCYSKTIEKCVGGWERKSTLWTLLWQNYWKMTLVDEREGQHCELCYGKTIENDFGVWERKSKLWTLL